VTGYTWSGNWVSGGFDTGYSGNDSEAFVVKLSPTGGHLWSSYLGGNSNDSGTGIALATGDVVLTGKTTSTGWIPGSSYRGGDSDGFVAKVADRALVISSVSASGIQIVGNKPGTTPYYTQCQPDEMVWLSAPDPATISGQRYNFLRWTLDGQPAPAGTALTVTMDADHTAVAQYALQTYTLTVQSSPAPGITISGDMPGTTNYTATCDDQQVVNLAAPATATVSGAEYGFLRWSLDGVDQEYGERNLQVLMDANHTAVSQWRLAGDVDGDCRVNVLDLITARNRLLLSPEDPANIDAIRQADVNGDGTVSILDMIFTRNRLGANCP